MSWRLGLALFAIALVARLPFGTENFYAPDSVLYARGIERFDPFEQRPQPPGYLWYILVLRLIDAVTSDPNRSMTLVSAFAGAATVALVYFLSARLYDERTARIAGLFMLTATTFWAYGGVAYPYTLLAALTTVCALLLWRVHDASLTRISRGAPLLVASIAYGLAIGFRSDLAIFLAPLWLISAIRTTVARAAIAALVVVALVLAWVAASGAADGGLARFLDAVRTQSQFIDERYSVFGNGPIAIYRNGYELTRFLGRGLYFLVPLVAVALISAEARRIELRDRWRAVFILIWTFAPLPFYLFIHVGEYGYIFSMLPGLAILAARGAIGLAKGLRRPRTLPWIVGGVALANAAIFLLSDTPISANDIARQDHGITEKLAYLKGFSPETTQLVTGYDAVLLQEYVAGRWPTLEFDPASEGFTRPLSCDRAPARAPCAGASVDIVLWDDLLKTDGDGWQEIRMPHGGRLRIDRVSRSASLRVHDGLTVAIVP